MPIYEYRCPQCSRVEEVRAPMGHELPACPDCRQYVEGEILPVLMDRQWVRPPLVPPSRVQS